MYESAMDCSDMSPPSNSKRTAPRQSLGCFAALARGGDFLDALGREVAVG